MQNVNTVINVGANLSPDVKLLEPKHHVGYGHCPCFSKSKNMAYIHVGAYQKATNNWVLCVPPNTQDQIPLSQKVQYDTRVLYLLKTYRIVNRKIREYHLQTGKPQTTEIVYQLQFFARSKLFESADLQWSFVSFD